MDRFGVATMVLVEVGKLVVEENRRTHILRDGELKDALVALDFSAIVESNVDVGFLRPLGFHAGVGILEGSADSTTWHIRKACAEIWGVVNALRIVKFDLSDLLEQTTLDHEMTCEVEAIQTYQRTSIKKQATDGREDNTNGKEQRQHRLRCQDWSIVSESAKHCMLSKRITGAHTAMPSTVVV